MPSKYAEEIRDEWTKQKNAPDPLEQETQAWKAGGALVPPPGASYASMTSPTSDARMAAMPYAEQRNASTTQATPYAGMGGAEHAVVPPPAASVVMARPPPAAPAPPTPGGGAGMGGGAAAHSYGDDIRQAYEAERAGIGRQTDAAAHAADAQAAGAAASSKQFGQDAADAMAGARARDKGADALMGDIERKSKAAAEMKEDPDHWYHSQSTADHARYTLAAMLGGLASGIKGGPNQIMAELSKRRDDDIRAQRTAIEQAHGRVTDARGALSDFYKRSGNMEQAEAAVRVLHIEQQKAQIAQEEAKTNSEMVRANGDVLRARLDREKAEEMRKVMAHNGGGLSPQKLAEESLKLQHEFALSPEEANARVAATYGLGSGAGVKPLERIPKEGEGGGGALDSSTPVPGSTNALEHPIDAFNSYFHVQGTEGNTKRMEREAANIPVHTYAHKVGGIRTPEGQREVYGGVLIGPNDTDETIRQKLELRRQLARKGGGPAAGLPAGSSTIGNDEEP